MININKEQFENAYRKFPPTKFERFFIKHIINLNTTYAKRWVILAIFFILVIPLLIMILFNVKLLTVKYINILELFYSFLLAFIGIIWWILWYLKRNRYNKIRKEINISKQQFNRIIKIYYFSSSYPTIQDIIE